MEKTQHEFQLLSLQAYTMESLHVQDDGDAGYFTVIRTFTPLKLAIGSQHYEVPGDKLVFIRPTKTIRLLSVEDSRGFVVSFTSSFYERSGSDSYILNSALYYDKEKALQVTGTGDTEADFRRIINNRLERCPDKHTNLYAAVAHACVEYLLLEGFLWLQLEPATISNRAFSPNRTVNTFLILVNQHCQQHTDVAYYAQQLHIAPRKLSDLCYQILGKSAKRVITDIVLTAALHCIRNSDLSISEIAYEMGFAEESNFRRFVKKHTGRIPSAFRNELDLHHRTNKLTEKTNPAGEQRCMMVNHLMTKGA
ncbi:AraC family transcriptional regulator [Parapedobacter sp. ISTM3]|uniref:helix-turn-helix domain-containing protein n=1 Tax=Parapedobacter sp. ISTM3 TaxID=2800130 RepID=UPI00190704EF|nr:helix-turn-helix domain-containing protein [Parapedobacter sp. ISTM3]MBK1439115.1 AraC family transcriptional regulator [Parapedobacter sp. ISTM3]